jgi:hypothetical protein
MATMVTSLFVKPPEEDEDGVDVGDAATMLVLVMEGSVGLVSRGAVLVMELVVAAAPGSRSESRFNSSFLGAAVGRTLAFKWVARRDNPATRYKTDFMINQKAAKVVRKVALSLRLARHCQALSRGSLAWRRSILSFPGLPPSLLNRLLYAFYYNNSIKSENRIDICDR